MFPTFPEITLDHRQQLEANAASWGIPVRLIDKFQPKPLMRLLAIIAVMSERLSAWQHQPSRASHTEHQQKTHLVDMARSILSVLVPEAERESKYLHAMALRLQGRTLLLAVCQLHHKKHRQHYAQLLLQLLRAGVARSAKPCTAEGSRYDFAKEFNPETLLACLRELEYLDNPN